MSYKIMRYKHLGLVVVLVSTTMLNAGYALAAGGHGPSPTTTMLRSTAAATSTVQAKTGEQNPVTSEEAWLIAERELWLPVVDQLDQHLMTARLDFMDKDNPNAAMEIRQGAEFLQQEEQGPGSPTDIDARAAAAADLIKLANQVEQGKVTSVDELNKAFVQAYQVDIEHRLVHLKAEELFPLTEKPAMHFHRATEAFKAKDAATAATEIHKALAFLKIEEAATSGPAKATLQAAIDRLETLAVEAAAGNVLAEAEMDQAFTQAQHALAHVHRLKAEDAIARDEMKEAGYELKAAIHHLEQALTQAGYKMEEVKTFDIKDMDALAEKLLSGSQVEVKEVSQALAQINQEIERLGQEISVQTTVPWLVIDDHTFIPVIDKISGHLQLAHQAFVDKDYTKAAQELRESAAFMKEEAAKLADKAGETAFQTTASDLEKLATEVEQGQMTRLEDLNVALFKAYNTDIAYRRAGVSAAQSSPLIEWPIFHLGQARAAFERKDTKMAADEIFKAVGFLRLEKGRATGETRTSLQNALMDLEKLAQQVREGKITTATDLDQAFLRAYHALGQHHYLKATAALDQKDMREAGYELRAATRYLEQAQAEMKQPAAASHDALRDMADKLIASKYPGADEAQPFINQIGQELEQLGQAIGKMSPQANTPPAADEWVVAEEKVSIPVLDGLGQHLQAASHSFANKDTQLAAQEMRAAATFLNVEAAKLTNTADQQALKAAMGELDKLAAAVEQGQVTSMEALNTVFAAAHQADVEHRLSLLKAEELAPFVEKPAIHFQRALTALEKKENDLAAQEIRKGVAFMRIAEGRASGPALTALQRSAEELADLAMQVANKQVTSITDLEKAFGRAHLALASYHQTRAVTAQTNSNLKEMGYELQAAANHLEQALSQAGSRIEEGNATLIKDLRALADQLIAGNQVEPKQISQVLENMGKKLEALGVELDIIAAAK